MDELVAPKPRFPVSSASSSSCPSPCPSTPRSILRSKCLQRTITPCGSCHVRFAEAIDEHTADDYDRSCCATANPTFREIRELERIRRELVPSGRGITDQDQDASEPGELCFGFDDGGDVDYKPKPKRRLRGVPIELCPILPADAPLLAPTPYNSNEPSPLGSPVIAPVDTKRAFQPRAKMSFLPILAPSEPAPPALSTPSETPIPTPPETPTLVKLDLCADDARSSPPPHPSDAAPPPTEQRRVNSPKPNFPASSPSMPYVVPPSRPAPSTCRMAIMPVLSTHSLPTQRTSPNGSPRQYGPISTPMQMPSVYTPLPMSFKRTART